MDIRCCHCKGTRDVNIVRTRRSRAESTSCQVQSQVLYLKYTMGPSCLPHVARHRCRLLRVPGTPAPFPGTFPRCSLTRSYLVCAALHSTVPSLCMACTFPDPHPRPPTTYLQSSYPHLVLSPPSVSSHPPNPIQSNPVHVHPSPSTPFHPHHPLPSPPFPLSSSSLPTTLYTSPFRLAILPSRPFVRSASSRPSFFSSLPLLSLSLIARPWNHSNSAICRLRLATRPSKPTLPL